MLTRRRFFSGAGLAVAATAVAKSALGALPEIVSTDSAAMQPPLPPPNGRPYQPVATLNGWTLPWRMRNGIKEFHLVAEPVIREIAPGMKAHLWGYNGQSPGPTIEVVEGDRVRIFVTNRLPEHTSVHWHGQRLPNGMDGVAGLNQPVDQTRTDLCVRIRRAARGNVHVPPACGRNHADGDGHDGILGHSSTRTPSSCRSTATTFFC